MTSQDFRRALGHFVTGVTVVTTRCSAGTPQGITANSFTSVSLDPPLNSVNLSRTLASFAHFRDCRAFAVHLLGADQHDVSARFARRGEDKWRGVETLEGELGIPLLATSLGMFECTRHAIYEAGDHEILLGRVEQFKIADGIEPLAFFRGSYRQVTHLTVA